MRTEALTVARRRTTANRTRVRQRMGSLGRRGAGDRPSEGAGSPTQIHCKPVAARERGGASQAERRTWGPLELRSGDPTTPIADPSLSQGRVRLLDSPARSGRALRLCPSAASRDQAERDPPPEGDRSRRASRARRRDGIRTTAASRHLRGLPGERTLASLGSRPGDRGRSQAGLPPLLPVRALRWLRRGASPSSRPVRAPRRGLAQRR